MNTWRTNGSEAFAVSPSMELSVGTLRALALALAGGATEDLSFAEAARRAGQREQWSWEQLLETPAWLVDRAAGAGGTLPGDGWSTFVFPGVTRFDELAAAMVENLLMRSIDEPVSTPDREAGADGPRPNRSPLANSPSPMSDSPSEAEVVATRMSEKKPNVPQPISPSEASKSPRVVLRHPIALEPNVTGPAQALPRSAGSAAQDVIG